MVKAQGNNKNTSVKATAVYASANVNAKPVDKNSSVDAVNNLSKYYSEISKDYAEQSKTSANNASDTLEQVREAGETAISNISMLEGSVSDSINAGINQIGETTEQGLNDLQIASDEHREELTNVVEQGIEDIQEIIQNAGGGNIDESNLVHIDSEETITGPKTFTEPLKVQNGAETGSLIIGADVNAGTLTDGTRKLARVSVPMSTNKTLFATLLGFDSSGDNTLNVANNTYDVISFGGQKKITNATSPMAISFCVTKDRGSKSATDKIIPLEMDANEARFNIQPNYNGDNLVTKTELDTKQGVLNATDPIRIGTTTIGEPNNINVLNGVITPTVVANAKRTITSYSSNETYLDFYGATDTTASFEDLFKEKSYLDIPINFGNYFTDDYTYSQYLEVVLSGMTNAYANNSFTFFVGQLLDGKFKVYATANIETATAKTGADIGCVSIANSIQEPTYVDGTSTRVRYKIATSAYDTGASYTSNTEARKAILSIGKTTDGKIQVQGTWHSGSYKYRFVDAELSSGSWQLSDLQNCNVIRVVFNNYSSSYATTAYLPTSEGTYVRYYDTSGADNRLAWNIENSIVKTYGISLNIDNETLKIVDGKLSATASGGGLQMFDTVLKDHVLTFEESKGLALQGTYVYKEAVAGSRYGYADFYNKCLEEYNEANNEAYLKSNVTKVGSIVDNQGVLSGFSASNYAEIANGKQDNNAEYVFKFTTGSNITTAQVIFHAENFANIELKGGYCTCYDWAVKGAKNLFTATTNTTYWVKVLVNGNVKSYSYSTDGSIFTDAVSFTDTGMNISANYPSRLGQHSSSTTYTFVGTIDLNKCYINVNGSRFWTGTEKAKQNANGHIFYDIAQKDVVDDIFEQTGMAWMYGVDTENERIYLPRNNWFEQLTANGSEVGKSVEAGLPNHQHSPLYITGSSSDNGDPGGLLVTANGSSNGVRTVNSSRTGDVSNSSIYGKYDTVQPNSVKKLLYICVGNTETISAVTDVVEVTTTENDTTPLFTGMYFDFAPNNVSWLKGGEQKNSGGVYTFCYNELVNELTNPKYNLKVINEVDMVGGVDYSEYWKVNQDRMTFVTPSVAGLFPNNRILVAKKEPTGSDATWYNLYSDGWLEQGGIAQSTAANEGAITTLLKPYKDTNYILNVMVISSNTNFTNDTVIWAKQTNKTTSTFKTQTGYGADVGSAYSVTWQTSGYTEIPTVSDYTENVNLYFKVANAVQNLELLDAGEVLEAVNNVVPNNRTVWDGQWVYSIGDVFSSRTFTANEQVTFDISSYLPKDNYIYEVIFNCFGRTGNTSGNSSGSSIKSSVMNDFIRLGRAVTRTANSMAYSGNAIIPIGTDRTLIYVNVDANGTSGNTGLQMLGYRRMGTNQ